MEIINNPKGQKKSDDSQENNSFDRLKSTSKDEKELYESVFHKQYQMIQTFLEKINSLYCKNEQFEHSLNILQEKLAKIEGNNTNIHYEFRTTHFMMDKRLNTIMDDFNNITQQIQHLKTDSSKDNQQVEKGSPLNKEQQGKKINQVEQIKQRIQASNRSLEPNTIVNQVEKSTIKKISNSSSVKVNIQRKALQNLQLSHPRISLNNRLKLPESKLSISSSEKSFQEQEEQVYQTNQSKQPKQQKEPQKYGIIYSMEWVQNQFSKHMEQFTNKLDNFTQQWREQKEHIRNQIFGQEAEKFISKLQQRIQDKMKKLYQKYFEEQQTIKKEISIVNETSLKNIGALEYKLSQKVQNQYFQDSMNNLTTAFSIELSKKQKTFCNKHQTQRAIRFLQKKINKIIQQDQNINNSTIKGPKDGKMGQQGCLRINRCASQKKSEVSASEKNIHSKMLQISNNGLNSINFSAIDQEQNDNRSTCKQNNFKGSINSNEPTKKINWKGLQSDKIPSTFKIHSQAKIRKSSITKIQNFNNRASYSNFAHVQKVVEKQWKQKVVKVLNSRDKKRVKVTFH